MADIAWITFSLICVFANIVPLAWQIEHRNSGPVCLGFWVIVANLNSAINGLVWRNDAINRAPIWCDIAVKLQVAAPMGILLSDICILALLARVMGPKTKLVTHRERRIRIITDIFLSIGLPLIFMALSVLWMPYRFDLSKSLGCIMTVVNVWPIWAFYAIWPPILSFIGCLLATYVGYRLVEHRRNFKKLIQASDSALTTSRFIRLGLLSSAFLLFNLPLSIYQLVYFAKNAGPYYAFDWKQHRSGAGHVDYVNGGHAGWQEWSMIIAGLLVIVFFGFGNEAISYYIVPLRWLGLLKPRSDRVVGKTVAVSHITLTRYEAESSSREWVSSPGAAIAECQKYTGPFHKGDDVQLFDDMDVEKVAGVSGRV